MILWLLFMQREISKLLYFDLLYMLGLKTSYDMVRNIGVWKESFAVPWWKIRRYIIIYPMPEK